MAKSWDASSNSTLNETIFVNASTQATGKGIKEIQRRLGNTKVAFNYIITNKSLPMIHLYFIQPPESRNDQYWFQPIIIDLEP